MLHRWSNCSLARATVGRVMCRGIISSCQTAATSKTVKALLVTSLTHVSSAIASTRLYLFICYLVSFSLLCYKSLGMKIYLTELQLVHIYELVSFHAISMSALLLRMEDCISFLLQVVGCRERCHAWSPFLTQWSKSVTATQSQNRLQRHTACSLLVLPRM